MSETMTCRNGGRSRCTFASITPQQRSANRREMEKAILQIAQNAVARHGVQGAVERITHGAHADLMPWREEA